MRTLILTSTLRPIRSLFECNSEVMVVSNADVRQPRCVILGWKFSQCHFSPASIICISCNKNTMCIILSYDNLLPIAKHNAHGQPPMDILRMATDYVFYQTQSLTSIVSTCSACAAVRLCFSHASVCLCSCPPCLLCMYASIISMLARRQS